MLWRFLPVLDPQVDVMVSRDLDSRLTTREQAAVQEWLHTGLAFHVMRDNPMHGTEILGGMWGARLDSGLRTELAAAMSELLDNVSPEFCFMFYLLTSCSSPQGRAGPRGLISINYPNTCGRW